MRNTNFKQLKNKNVLITGGCGFIGSHLIEALLEHGANVKCLDNLSTGKFENIKEFYNNSSFEFIEGDIRDFDTCKKALQNFDYVSHQAALGSVPRSLKTPLITNGVNVTGFLNVIEAARLAKVKRFVFAASSSTYGDNAALPKIESEIGRPLSPYAVTKLINELYAEVYKQSFDFDSIGLRYFNVFGPRQDPNGAYAAVIPKFISSLLQGKSPVINGDGSFSRDYTYVDNVVEANLLALTTSNKRALNEIYNIAFGERTTLVELVNLLKERLLNYDSSLAKIKPEFGPERPGDVPHSLASIQKAINLLGYKPQCDISEGLTKAIDWYYENLKIET
ncbi:UDP-N-acetylglucosamine 4-epimerase [Leeuwenhoekiella aestuarii]|uniref:UDP-N-acetylglucosamine 4-epimerase n=1 Tax=Leeuwenhoekiella aestuarii TaxID=2249426 RepID=A0A4V1KPP1_9FLAO|nr:SDR family oxidoreductase [Leeuwenhoekiella aestuarii]RXG16081.1 UDP-N-acetylglucosamine 4-epimerase [Leeuwenhoekiella aestuarii]RXG16775.1 UDP-N-acetylglucosamine 4-epimerase [Leeuwenhoekiella aestuarii]